MRTEQLVPLAVGLGMLALILFGLPGRRKAGDRAARVAAHHGWQLEDGGAAGRGRHRFRGTAASGPWLLEIAPPDPEDGGSRLRWSCATSPARGEVALLIPTRAPGRAAGGTPGGAGWAARAVLGLYLRGTFGVTLDAIPALRDARPPLARDYPLRGRCRPLFSDEATARRFLAACGPRLLAWDREPPALLLWGGGLMLVYSTGAGGDPASGENPCLDPSLCAAVVALGTGLLEDYRGACLP